VSTSSTSLSRRDVLALAGAAAAFTGPLASTSVSAATGRSDSEPFGYCLNTSTIRGQKVGVVAQMEIAAQAGYDAVEPWMREIEEYLQNGGTLKDLASRIRDLGLTVESAIGFASWIVDDDQERAKGLEQARRDMDILQQIGGKRLAAPPVGATRQTDLDLFKAAERYRALLELGEEMNVVPQVEVWGFSKSLSRLGETLFVAVESGHPDACVLPDVYHIYKGGSEFAGLKLLSGEAIHVFHVNDYPAEPPRATISDAHRVYPGDGIAPLGEIFRMLKTAGFRGYLSLELFNPEYWKQDALTVAKTGLEKTKAAVRAALA
jgi:2-keto-myo-inositol isomerase